MPQGTNESDSLKKLPAVSRKYVKLIDDYLAPYQLNSSVYYYLLKLHDFGDLPQEQLVQLTGVNASNVTRGIQKLVENQYVERKENPHDRRGHLLSLTKAGHDMYEVITEALQKANRDFFAPLSTAEQITFIETINKLSQ